LFLNLIIFNFYADRASVFSLCVAQWLFADFVFNSFTAALLKDD
jgi:hypothetical protein